MFDHNIKNIGNSCYIDSLLVGLFYKKSSLDTLLNNSISNNTGIYLQEYIRHYFVENLRNGREITDDVMLNIRRLCNVCGWQKSGNIDMQCDVNEFYIFLLELFKGDTVKIKRKSLTEGMETVSDTGNVEEVPFISLSLPDKNVMDNPVEIKELIANWMYDNYSEVKRDVGNNIQMNVRCINTYNLANSPQYICLSINRYVNGNIKLNNKIIIQKKIKFSINEKYFGNYSWKLHSVICHKTFRTCPMDEITGHYYTLININDEWLIFDDLNCPSFKKVKMNDREITDDIKENCVFLVYVMN